MLLYFDNGTADVIPRLDFVVLDVFQVVLITKASQEIPGYMSNQDTNKQNVLTTNFDAFSSPKLPLRFRQHTSRNITSQSNVFTLIKGFRSKRQKFIYHFGSFPPFLHSIYYIVSKKMALVNFVLKFKNRYA